KVGGSLGPIAASDLHGFGVADIVVASDSNVAVMHGNGDGTFQAAVEWPIGYPASALVLGDIDGDGRPDVEAMRPASAPTAGVVSVLHQRVDGLFEDGGSYAVGPGAFGLAAADFDGDGLADLATSNNGMSTVAILFSLGAGRLEATRRVPTTYA